MSIAPLFELIAREHPALVHVPLGTVIALPLAMVMSFRGHHRHAWKLASFFLAALACASSLVALFSGLLWGRQIALIAPGGFIPHVANAKQVLQKTLQLHELAALTGATLGLLCLILLWRSLREDRAAGPQDSPHRRLADRGVGLLPLFVALLWVGSWGFCGKLGGILVFGNEATNKAAAEADAAKRADVEAELPIRALDYASLEPATPGPARSAHHSNRWVRVWVTASGIDAYKAGKQLPPGAYAVMSTYEDLKGKPSFEPGPLYFRETKADGTPYVAFYWGRVPEDRRSETGGEDFVYLRSPNPKLQACTDCHRKMVNPG